MMMFDGTLYMCMYTLIIIMCDVAMPFYINGEVW